MAPALEIKRPMGIIQKFDEKGEYKPIPFLSNSYYYDDNFSRDDNPRNKIDIRIELYSFEDIYELASSRNDVFFRLLKNEFNTEKI